MLRSVAPALAALALALPVMAADFSDPTWPCIQRKVESLSAGLMWSSPVDPAALPQDPAVTAEIANLAEVLALRRVDLEEVRPQVEDFADRHGGDANLLGAVFAEVFKSLDTRRSRVIRGIGEFSLGQIALSQKIEASRVEMDAQMAKAEPDYDRVDALEEQIDWDQVIFTDRQSSIQYLCETPVLIEKRLFAIAQMLQQMVKTDG